MASFQCSHCPGTGRGVCSRPAPFCARCCRQVAIVDGFVCTRHHLHQAAHPAPPQQPAPLPQQLPPGPVQQLPPPAPQPLQSLAVNAGPAGLPGPALPSPQAMIQHLHALGYHMAAAPAAPPSAALPPSPPQAPVLPPAAFNIAPAIPAAPGPAAAPLHLSSFGPLNGVSPAQYMQAAANPASVLPSTHIHNSVTNNNYAGRSLTSPASLFSGMTNGLAPVSGAQAGPTLEQLLARNVRDWKPFRNASELREALEDWRESFFKAHLGDPASLNAAAAYVQETLGILDKVGHSHAFQYHKAAFRAASHDPPLYDPLTHGSRYDRGYSDHVAPYLNKSYSKGGSSSSVAKAPSDQQQQTTGGKRPRNDQCTKHPNSDHTNADCNAQKASKRQAGAGGSGATSTPGK
jgi:hypothetical protein